MRRSLLALALVVGLLVAVVTSPIAAAVLMIATIGVYAISWLRELRSASPRIRRVGWATVALWVVRLWIGALLVSGGMAALGVTDRSLGDRLSFQEYGFTVPRGGGKVEEHNGPWLVLALDVDRRLCPALNRPYSEGDPTSVPFYGGSACGVSKAVRAQLGDVDVDGLTLVRQVEGPPGSVERHLMLVLLLGFGCVLLGSVALERILRLTSIGQPFSRPAVTWLRVLAAGVAGAAVVTPFVTDRFIDGLTRKYFTAGELPSVNDGTTVNLGAVFAVLLILVIAEVWRTGINLQRDVEATV